jgi:hypothetical protein
MSSGLLRLFGKIPGPVWAVVVSSLFGFLAGLEVHIKRIEKKRNIQKSVSPAAKP